MVHDTPDDSPQTSVAIELALGGHSPVSLLDDEQLQMGRPDHAAQYNGQLYHFVDEAQRATFLANPERYEPAFGGLCAYGIAVGAELATDPSTFKIVDDQILVFALTDELDARQLWEDGDESELLSTATVAWQQRDA